MQFLEDSDLVEARLIHELARFDGAVALDVGGGDGRLTAKFAPRAAHTALLDPDPQELDLARQALLDTGVTHVGLCQGSAAHLPYPPDSFDLVVFSWSL